LFVKFSSMFSFVQVGNSYSKSYALFVGGMPIPMLGKNPKKTQSPKFVYGKYLKTIRYFCLSEEVWILQTLKHKTPARIQASRREETGPEPAHNRNVHKSSGDTICGDRMSSPSADVMQRIKKTGCLQGGSDL